jgi:hypothetical protein
MVSPVLAGSGLGLGINYNVQKDMFGNKKENWGGSVGVGGAGTNLTVSFSQHGSTTISGSYSLNNNIAFSSSYNTGSGVANVGANYSFDEGSAYEALQLDAGYSFHTRPNQGLPFVPNDREKTGFSGGVTVSPTMQGNPDIKPSMQIGFDPDGVTSSVSTNGVNLGSVNANGFTAGEQNWSQNNISAAQALAGKDGDKWLEGTVESGVDFVYDNVLKPIGNGIMDIGNYIIDGVQSIPQKLADLFLPQIPMPQLSFNLESIFNGGSFIDGNSFNMQGSGGSLFDLVTDNPFNDESINDLKDEYNKPGGLGLDDDFVREKLLETMIANSCGSAKTCDKLHLSNSVLSAIIDIVKIGVRESDLSKLNKSLATEAVQAEIKNTVDQFVVKNQTYDAAIEKMTEALNSGKLTDSDKDQLEKNIAYTLNEKTNVMNEYNKSISSLSQYQIRLESTRNFDYMGQSLENFPLLSDELRSLSLFMDQGNRANSLMSEVADFRDPNLQNISRNNLSYYLKARQERIGRDNSPQTFSYQVQIGGKTQVIRLINDRNQFFQQLEKGFKNQ